MNTNCYFDVNEFVNDLDSHDDYGPQGDVVDEGLDSWYYTSLGIRISKVLARAQQLKPVVKALYAQWESEGKYNPQDKGYSFVAGKLNGMGLRGHHGGCWNALTVRRLMWRIKVLGESYNKKESN